MKSSLLAVCFLGACLLSPQSGPPLRVSRTLVLRSGPFEPDQFEAESEFLTTDPLAVPVITWTGGKKGDRLRMEWKSPSGTVLQSQTLDLSGPDGTFRGYDLPIADAPPSTMPGKWELQVFLNDSLTSSSAFTITRPPNTVVNLVSRTLLPFGALQVRYFFQLRAAGGSAPYRWSLVGNAPPGMNLSSSGEISGAPTRGGNYRVVVRAEDSAGNSVTRALGFGVQTPLPGRRVTAHLLTKSPSSPDACATPGGSTDFLTTDLSAWVAFSVEGAQPGDLGEVQWLNPAGEVEESVWFNHKPEYRRCYELNLPIAGAKASSMPGNWRVRLLWWRAEIMSIPFQISDATVAVLPGRHALVVGNGAFKNLPPIPSAAAETAAVAKALRQDGFDVIEAEDLSLAELRRVESDFTGRLRKGDVAVVYFTGYGFQRGNDNWLLATNFDPRDSAPLANAYSVVRLREALDAKGVRLAIVALDAAHELPALASRAQAPGLARMAADSHIVYVYAVPPGRTETRPQDASPGAFAQAFVRAIRTESMGVQDLLLRELPNDAATLAPGRPAPSTLLETSEEFVFRTPAVNRPVEFAPEAAARELSGEWEFGRAAGTEPRYLPGPRCKFSFTANRGKFGNVIEGSRCSEIFWRLEGQRLYVLDGSGLVTTAFSQTADGYWTGGHLELIGIVHYLKRPREHKEIPIDAKTLDSYAGRYQLAPEFIIAVTKEGDHLFVQATGQQKFAVFPEINRDFFCKAVDAQFTFEIDRQGRTAALVLHQNGKDQRAKRIE